MHEARRRTCRSTVVACDQVPRMGRLGQEQRRSMGLGRLLVGQATTTRLLSGSTVASGRSNVADFAVGETSIFADRARRFTGLAFVGSFDGARRRIPSLRITTDLRLAPSTKIKPDSGSTVALRRIEDEGMLPFAFAREQGAVRSSARRVATSTCDQRPSVAS